MPKTLPTRSDRLFERARVELQANRTWLASLLGGFLVGRLTNALSDSGVKTMMDAMMSAYGLDRPVNLVTWVTSILLLMIPAWGWLLEWFHRKRGYESLLANLMVEKTDPLISPYAKGVIAWGSNVTLQTAPDLRYGWPLSCVSIAYSGDLYVMPEAHVPAYQRYLEENLSMKRFFDDGEKFMLVRNPVAFSGSPTLLLDVHKTKYSHIQYFRDKVASLPDKRNEHLDTATRDLGIDFPHSLCMHTVVVTSDERILLTRRSPKVSYFPGAWSVSVEEQLSPVDFQGDDRGIVSRWARRLLLEELGLPEEQCKEDNFRVLSVFIEADILNCSLSALARLELTSDQLSKVLSGRPRTDYEFSDWLFLTFAELRDELLRPSRPQHPSSGYRSLFALVKKWGVPRLADTLFRGRDQSR